MQSGQSKYSVIILTYESSDDHLPWVNACEIFSDVVEYRVVDITKSTWLEDIISSPCELLLAKPPVSTVSLKLLYDERVRILSKEFNIPVFPFYEEILLYENKRFLSYWLKVHKIPHPKTKVFYYKHEALEYIESCVYPIVAKISIGASGNGVRILKSRSSAKAYVEKLFSTGITSRVGPRLDKGDFIKRAWRKMTHISELKERLAHYKKIANDPQKDFCLFYEYIPHDFEWRVVRVGSSFFAYKKMKVGEKASGLMHKVYFNPPFELLDFVKEITDKFKFRSVAIDVFERAKGDYLVNEIQCIWGQKNDYQLKVDGIPGRYVSLNEKWKFEKGEFTQNKSYTLRLEYALSMLKRNHRNE